MPSIDRDALKFVADELRSEAGDSDITDEEREEYEERFYESLRDEDFEQLEEICEELEEDHGMSMQSVTAFADMVKTRDLVDSSSKDRVEAELSEGLSQAIKMQVKKEPGDEMIVRTDEPVAVNDLFSIHEQLYEDHGKKAFIISDQKTWSGRISVELSSTKEKVQLLKAYDGDNGTKFSHVGQSNSNYKGMKIEDEHTHGFYVYKFVSSQDQEKLVFSTEKLRPMTCELHGMQLKLSDFKQFGENTGLPVDRDIIFAHSVEPAIKELSQPELQGIADKADHDYLASSILGGWRHPEWFEKMLLSMLLVNEEHGYPSGLIWMARTGTGKSKVIESLADAFDEKHVFSGTRSTINGLTPSFAESPPDEGFLLRSERVSVVDEMFNLLAEARKGNGNLKDTFRPLLDLIEHQDRTFSSGNGSIRGKMQSIMIGAGNDSYGVSSMYEAADKLDQAFLGRFLLYEQTQQHIDWIEDRKMEINEQEVEKPSADPEFISLVDHMQSEEEVVVDKKRVMQIKKDLQGQIPANFTDIYRSRYDHHIKNLVSGHAKYRALCSGDVGEIEAEDEDYGFARRVVEILVNSWSKKANLEDMSVPARQYYINRKKRDLFEFVRAEFPVSKSEMDDEFDTDVGYKLKELRELELVEEMDGVYYPFFADELRDAEGYKNFKHIDSSMGERSD